MILRSCHQVNSNYQVMRIGVALERSMNQGDVRTIAIIEVGVVTEAEAGPIVIKHHNGEGKVVGAGVLKEGKANTKHQIYLRKVYLRFIVIHLNRFLLLDLIGQGLDNEVEVAIATATTAVERSHTAIAKEAVMVKTEVAIITDTTKQRQDALTMDTTADRDATPTQEAEVTPKHAKWKI